MSTLPTMITIALRLFQNSGKISALWPRVQTTTDEVNRIWQRVQGTMADVNTTMTRVMQLASEVQALAQQIAPELVGTTARITQTYDVRWLQTALKTLGYDPGPIDGELGPRTTAAIKSFQQANGLVADGWAGIATEAKLDQMLRAA